MPPDFKVNLLRWLSANAIDPLDSESLRREDKSPLWTAFGPRLTVKYSRLASRRLGLSTDKDGPLLVSTQLCRIRYRTRLTALLTERLIKQLWYLHLAPLYQYAVFQYNLELLGP